jgi:CubicO group peptidase (beta-lactamase class C family)
MSAAGDGKNFRFVQNALKDRQKSDSPCSNMVSMTFRYSAVRLAFFTLFLPIVLCGQADRGKQIDAIFEPWNNTSGPGAAVSVIRDGKLIFEKGYGLANLEYDVPIGPETIFHVASVSKQFTAMALVLLERDGKLSIDDDVHKYLPELPDYGHPVAIRNLLQHTSGIRDQWQTLGLAGWSLEDVITQDQILRMLFRQKELNFPPGTEHLYSNGGYTLAAEIVTRVSGKPFPEFCAERIFKPLGMAHTHFHQDLHQIVRNRAYSYSGSEHAYAAAPLNYANVGATSLFTTATDLTKWLDNFREPVVGGKAAIARLTEQAVLSDGKKIDYALGVSVAKHRGLATISHSGGDAGFRSYVCWYPDQQLGIAVVSNLGSFNPGAAADKVAAVYLESKMTPEPAAVKRTFIAVDPAILRTFVGTYPLPQIGQTLVVVAEGGKLFASGPVQPPLEMKAVSPSTFYVEPLSAEVAFTPASNGGMKVRITQPGAVNEAARTANDPPKADAAHDFRPYVGAYWSEELETQYNFSIVNGKLIATHAHHGVIALTPRTADSFRTDKWFMSDVNFVRDGEGRVTAVTIGGGRLRGIRFVKK